MKDAYPINVLNAIKQCPEVCTIYCASANPIEVIVAVTEQGRGVMGVVIKPGEPKSEGETALDFGRRCLKEFLAKGKGEELAQRPMKAVPLTAPELSMFTSHFQTHDGNRTWGGPVAWYTDGRAVAVFLRKESQISCGPDTPWF